MSNYVLWFQGRLNEITTLMPGWMVKQILIWTFQNPLSLLVKINVQEEVRVKDF